jgi:hypothetical protein
VSETTLPRPYWIVKKKQPWHRHFCLCPSSARVHDLKVGSAEGQAKRAPRGATRWVAVGETYGPRRRKTRINPERVDGGYGPAPPGPEAFCDIRVSGVAAVGLARLVKLKLATDGDELRLCRLDLRKGFAFPEATSPKQPPPGRLEGSAFKPARRRTKGAESAGKPEKV